MALADYIALIQRFLNNEISAVEFERDYIDLFQNGPEPEEQFEEPLYWLFTEVDAYSDDPNDAAEDPEESITEEQLRQSAQEALRRLRN